MTKLQSISTPVITKDVLDFLKTVCDIPPISDDSSKALRWKAAQRDVYLRIEHIYNQGIAGSSSSSQTAERLGINIRSEE